MTTLHIKSSPGTRTRLSFLAPKGSAGNPLDGSTREKLEAILRTAPEGATLMFGPGAYALGPSGHNSPSAQWDPKSWVIRGSGMYNTVLRLEGCDKPGRHCMFSNHCQRDFDGMELHDLTLDLDVSHQPESRVCVQGVSLSGSDILLRRVRVVRFGTRMQAECFPLQLFEYEGQMRNVVMESCVAERPERADDTDGVTALSISPATALATASASCVIRNCVVNLGPVGAPTSNGRYSHAFSAPTVEGCYSFGAQVGIYLDTWNHAELNFRNNDIKLAERGIDFNFYHNTRWMHGDVTIADNRIGLRPGGHALRGIRLLGPGREHPPIFRQLVVRGNHVMAAETDTHVGIAVMSTARAFFDGNICDTINFYGAGSVDSTVNLTTRGESTVLTTTP